MSKALYDYFTMSEDEAVDELLISLQWGEDLSCASRDYAVDLVKRIRKTRRKPGSLESFFQEYGLNTQEGLSLMSMAEALLRIPDTYTANALIKDKISGTNWLKSANQADKSWMTKVAGLGLKLSSGTMSGLFSKVGEPVIREAMTKAMRVLGKQFVVGETLSGAATNAKKWEEKGFRFSYDMLGEGARTADQAKDYFEAYRGALLDIVALENIEGKLRPGISVKLSALHPRYEYAQKEKSIPLITERLIALCEIAAKNDIQLTIDAEEVARLSLSLEIIENVCKADLLQGWTGFGLAIQAYQKAAPAIIDYLISLAQEYDCQIQVRLVKGAYWDSEIKHAQIEGLKDYPVYTRKSNTDLSYLRCAQKLLRNRDVLYPMFGTHNAHTVATVIQMAGEDLSGFEFQKLYGMGDALYNQIIADHALTVSVYAPVGPYNELLPYLVRRMLENGANSSFVNQIYDKSFKPEQIVFDPVQRARDNAVKHHPKIPLPKDIYGDSRVNSAGIDFNNPDDIKKLEEAITRYKNKNYKAVPVIGGKKTKKGTEHAIQSPALDDDWIGHAVFTNPDLIENIFETAKVGYRMWSQTKVSQRAKILEKIADSLEENHDEITSLCVREGGKTLKDVHDEIREAVDFCRYYAAHGRRDFLEGGRSLLSPTGESNVYSLKPRGIFVCISPWNFPIAIYTGQVVAALMAGNAVIAKPAEQTSLIGAFICDLFYKAGVPPAVLGFVPGDGDVGSMLVSHPDVAGVAFTGSTQVAQIIAAQLAQKETGIPKLIAETGGLNAMIVDSSALMEQVVDDVIASAFGSAGQRCSACRVLFVQNDVFDKTVTMLKGAIDELSIGVPSDLSTDIGPLIDEEALRIVQGHKTKLSGFGQKMAAGPLDGSLRGMGHYSSPALYQIDDIKFIKEEIFGPVLHVISYEAKEIDQVIRSINEMGYGLTFGIHSRINSFIQKVTDNIRCGNVYVNRSTIGAVVGVQPFGGRGLSGTGPKAGGPQYLHAFATEKVVSTDTTAAGGNASLVMLDED